jgi:hypothetical protein
VVASARGAPADGPPDDLAPRGFAIALFSLAGTVASSARYVGVPVPAGLVWEALVVGAVAAVLGARVAIDAPALVAASGAALAGAALTAAVRRGGPARESFLTTAGMIVLCVLVALLPRGAATPAWCVVAVVSALVLRRRPHAMFATAVGLSLVLATVAHVPGTAMVPAVAAVVVWVALAGVAAPPGVHRLRAACGAGAIAGAAVLAGRASEAVVGATATPTVRTAVLALGAVAAATAGRRGLREERALSWILLGAAAAHAAVVDLPAGRAGHRFAALAALGVALALVAPRPSDARDP